MTIITLLIRKKNKKVIKLNNYNTNIGKFELKTSLTGKKTNRLENFTKWSKITS